MSEDDILEDFKEAAAFIKEIVVSDDELMLKYKNGKMENYQFSDLKKVSIITTDEGPLKDDVFWLMMLKAIIMIPQGIPGEEKLLERLQKLPGFDNEEVIRAMSCTENNAFHVWG